MAIVEKLKVLIKKERNDFKDVLSFAHKQFKQIAKGGPTAFFSKILKLCLIILEIILLVPAALIVLIVRALRPLVVIRFGHLDSGRIGHFAANTEVYLCERDAGMYGKKAIDIFYHRLPACNQQLKKMWDRVLPVFPFAILLDKVNRFLPGGEEHMIPRREGQDRDIHGLLAFTKPHIYFTQAEERMGICKLRELGIPEGSHFVCFCVRDSAYLNNAFPHIDWRYHDYRDSDVYNCLPAAEELTRRGYFMIRMGAIVKEKIKTANRMIIDYALNGRSDFLDIFLSSKCKFFISSAVGLTTLPMIFRRPIALINLVPLGYAPTWGPHDLFIPKKLWLKDKHRFMDFREIFDSGADKFLSSQDYDLMGIEVVENTPEEITALVLEMDQRLNGEWQNKQEDEELQERFWLLFKPSALHCKIFSRIGTDFLRNNKQLLG